MPKPQGTYIQTQKIAMISLRARRSKVAYSTNVASTRRAHLNTLNLAAAQNLAYQAYDFGAEPSNRGKTLCKKLGELVEKLDDLREELDKISEIHAELREPVFEYRAVRAGSHEVSAANVVNLAMVVLTVAMVLAKIFGDKKEK